MSRINFTTARPVEYSILVKPRADGPVLGFYAGHAIAAAVIDYFGRRYTYAGIAPRLVNGRYDIDSLRQGEWIVEPGLVYQSVPDEAGSLLKKQGILGQRLMTGSRSHRQVR